MGFHRGICANIRLHGRACSEGLWMRLALSALVAAAVMIAGPAPAQQSPMPEDLAWKLLELGRVIDPPKTAALYAPLQQKEPYQGVKVERDLKYGPADRHLLDVFTP